MTPSDQVQEWSDTQQNQRGCTQCTDYAPVQPLTVRVRPERDSFVMMSTLKVWVLTPIKLDRPCPAADPVMCPRLPGLLYLFRYQPPFSHPQKKGEVKCLSGRVSRYWSWVSSSGFSAIASGYWGQAQLLPLPQAEARGCPAACRRGLSIGRPGYISWIVVNGVTGAVPSVTFVQ